MTARRTYWHLEALKRKPTEYEVTSSELLYYRKRGFEVRTPLADWYERYQHASRLHCANWELFRDPRETTYATYTERQRDREIYVDGLLEAIESTGHDGRLDRDCVDLLGRVLGPLRFPFHGLQMIAAYVGSMAPSGRVAIALAFQAADEMRRVHRLAYRIRQLREVAAALGGDGKTAWQRDATWQPLRRVIERLLVTYDWGEALVALDLVVRPVVDELWLVQGGRLLAVSGDEVTPKIMHSLYEDSVWQREVTRALVRLAIDDDAAQRAVIAEWRDKWWGEASAVVDAAAPLFERIGNPRDAIERALAAYWAACGLEAR